MSNSGMFLVAEAGINHNGSLDTALKMVDAAKEAGVDAIKFQVFQAENFIADDNLTYASLNMKDLFKKAELSYDDFRVIHKKCKEVELGFFATPQNKKDVDFLVDELDVQIIKIGSDDLTTFPLLEYVAKKDRLTFLSCGMASLNEIQEALMIFNFKNVALLYCISLYPPEYKEFNLNKIDTLKRLYPLIPIGFSNHSQEIIVDLLSLAKGAIIFEHHFKLAETDPNPDTSISMDQFELQRWVRTMNAECVVLGTDLLVPTLRELTEMRPLVQRSLVLLKDVKKGDELTEENLGYMRPGTGIPAKFYKNVLGRTVTGDLTAKTILKYSHIEGV